MATLRIRIENFKSINNFSAYLSRINILIGKPDSGKSNILEGLFLAGIPHIAKEINKLKLPNELLQDYLKSLIAHNIRFKSYLDLFHSWETNKKIIINIGELLIEYILKEEELQLKNMQLSDIEHIGVLKNSLPIRFYHERNLKLEKSYSEYIPSYLQENGKNFDNVAMKYENLKVKLQTILENYNLQQYIKEKYDIIHPRTGNSLWPELIADGLKRFIYFYVAIASNDFYAQQYGEKPIILLEEPELKMYPDLINELMEIILKSKNYFVISTHNPFLLSFLINSNKIKKEELKIFGVKKEQNETKVYEISLEKAGEKLMDADEIIKEWEELV
ncbi:hypothetical protein DRN69_00520 [Candidatus Pacearchaeota archaeon]|nr:MAG: hypothetical protein DRN69_00520 [Candidatus Pacearchaeota archaeon]